MEGSWIDADWLWGQLRRVEAQVTVLDCRSAHDFSECHIGQAVHLSLPSIMLRRLAGGKVSIASVLKCSEARQRLAQAYGKHTFVLCGDTPPGWCPPMAQSARESNGGAGQAPPPLAPPRTHPHEMMPVLHKSLLQDGCLVVCLEGGMEEFRTKYPEWCVTKESEQQQLTSLRLPAPTPSTAAAAAAGGTCDPSTSRSSSVRPLNRRPGSLGSRSASDSEEERPDSSLESAESMLNHPRNDPEFGLGLSGFSLGLSVGLRLGLDTEPLALLDVMDHVLDPVSDPDPGFPVEILPQLFLGNAQNSSDCDALDKHRIRYVVNVTPNLPNVFEDSGSIQYLQIPITDHWSQNLASFFPTAITFIDGARERGEGVLVHCLAGISRSVTITVAYLMYKMSMSLNDAYDFVRRKKANISPNFNFMGQLLDFERQLNPPSPQRCTCHLPDTTSTTSTSSAAPATAAPAVVGDTPVVIPFTRLSIEDDDDEEDEVVSSMSSKRLRTLVCRCQASLAQCHFTTPTTL